MVDISTVYRSSTFWPKLIISYPRHLHMNSPGTVSSITKDTQIQDLKDEIVKIGNMVNEEKLADYTALTVSQFNPIEPTSNHFLDREWRT